VITLDEPPRPAVEPPAEEPASLAAYTTIGDGECIPLMTAQEQAKAWVDAVALCFDGRRWIDP
jgi:hypothetical protein